MFAGMLSVRFQPPMASCALTSVHVHELLWSLALQYMVMCTLHATMVRLLRIPIVQ